MATDYEDDLSETPEPPPPPRRRSGIPVWAWVLIILAVVSVPVCVSVAVLIVPKVQDEARIVKSMDNMRNIVQMMLARSTTRGWPKYNGKNFVLSVVASGDVDAQSPLSLGVLFSPGDVRYTLEDADLDRYGEVTRAALASEVDFSELTSYAGRRNAEPEFRISSGAPVPVIADTSFQGVVLIGYSDGRITRVDWDELGIPDDTDPFETPLLGEDATHPDLRALSGW